MPNTAIEFRISPSMHPTCVEKYSDINAVTKAFETGHSSLTQVYKEKDRISKDTSLSLEGQAIAIQRIANAHKNSVASEFANTKVYLEKSIDALKRKLADTLIKEDELGSEIRGHYKSAAKRELLLREAINNGDLQTISAVLAAPGYLSGLTDEQQNNLRNQYYETIQPKLAGDLSMMDAALQTVIRAQVVIPEEFKKAGGSQLTTYRY